jgi:hypothetical protein
MKRRDVEYIYRESDEKRLKMTMMVKFSVFCIPLTICLFLLSIFNMHKIMNHVQQNTLHLYEMNAAVDFAVSDAPSV